MPARAILEFSQRLLKEPSSRLFCIGAEQQELVDKMVFVLNRRLRPYCWYRN